MILTLILTWRRRRRWGKLGLQRAVKENKGCASQRNAGSHAGFPHVKLETPNLIESHRTTLLSRRSAKFGWTNAMGIYGVIL